MAAIATPFSSEDPNAPAIFKSKEFINDRSSLTNRQLDLDELKSRRPLIIDKLKSNSERGAGPTIQLRNFHELSLLA